MRKRKKVTAIFLIMVFIVTGCSAMTNIKATTPGVSLKVKDRAYATLPVNDTFSTTSFGNYEFVVEKDGQEPLYGLLPQKFNVGYLLADLLTIPTMFLLFHNLFEVYAYYDIHPDKKIIRYSEDNITWSDKNMLPAESELAKKYYEQSKVKK